MSTIKADNIATLAGVSTSMANAVNGSAKAWVNFNGTGTVAIRASYNVSSITDNSTGDYTVNFTTAMSDANYSLVGTTSNGPGPDSRCSLVLGDASAAPTTTAARILTVNIGAGVLSDRNYNLVAIFR